MRKLKEVLRLASLGLSQHQIARSCAISQSTVHEYVTAARAANVQWPLPEGWDDGQIEQALFPNRPAPAVWRKHPEPDWPPIHEDLQKNKDLTLQLVWQERREIDPEGYAYSRFCDLYRRWLNKRDLVLRHEHRAGEKMFVDYAGATIPIYDRHTGAVQEAAVFVAVQGASSYTFADATSGQDLRNWIGSHIRAFEFFGGVAEVAVPDNLKSAVTHPSCRVGGGALARWPPSAAQTVRAVFPHTAFTKTSFERQWKGLTGSSSPARTRRVVWFPAAVASHHSATA